MRKRKWKLEDTVLGYAFVLPDLIGLLMFWILPMVYVFYLSFFKWNFINDKIFLGFQNYLDIFHDETFWHSIFITLKYVFLFVPCVNIAAILFAVLIHTHAGKFENLFRTLFFIPYAMSLVVAGAIWAYIFEQKFGFVNYILSLLHLPIGGWLASPVQAIFVIVLVSIWKYIGYYMVLYIVGLKEIPKELYEAATIDGAGGWENFFYITLPGLKRIIFFVLSISMINAFQIFDLFYVMTNGGPNQSTYITMMYIYERSFSFFDFGYSSTLSIMLFCMIFGFMLLQFKFLGEEKS